MREPMSVDELVAHGESRRGSKAGRLASWGLAAALVLVLASDRALHSASVTQGIDVFDILDFQQIPNVLFIVDTSSTMGGTVSDRDYWVGGDDTQSRLYQTKVAIRHAIDANKAKANFGIGQFGPGNDEKVLTKKAAWGPDYNRGPFIYVSIDGGWSVTDVGSDGNTTIMGDAIARIFQHPTSPSSSAVKYEDYDGKYMEEVPPPAASGTFIEKTCPSSCLYNQNTGVTTCPAGCEQEFLRSFMAVENGFGTPQAAPPNEPFASGNPVPDPVYTTPAVDPPPDNGRYYIKSRIFRDKVRYGWAPGPGGGGTTSPFTKTYGIPISKALSRGLKYIQPLPGADGLGVMQGSCPVPPQGLLGDDVADSNDGIEPRPCFQIDLMVGNILKVTKKKRMTFYLASAAFGLEDPSKGCPPGKVNDPVQPCGHTSAEDTKLLTTGSLRLELPFRNPAAGGAPEFLTATGPGFPAEDLLGKNPNELGGIQLGGDGSSAGDNTPLAATLQGALNYYNNEVFPLRPPTAGGRQKNFVILITDGDENCGTQAEAVAAAQALYDNPPTPGNRIETVVVVFPTGAANTARANEIAAAGSGGTRSAFQGGTLQDELTQAINAATAQANSGTFSAADTTVTESVFEFSDPMDPDKRYENLFPITFQPSFSMPGFQGHFRAFYNPVDGLEVAEPRWDGQNDTGEKLLARVTIPAGGSSFAALHGGATPTTIAASAALVKRRILTTVRNGVFVPTASGKFFDVGAIIDRTAQAGVTALWPPDATIDPTAAATAGGLDDVLGIGAGSTPVLTFTQLRSEFGACGGKAGATLPTSCPALTFVENFAGKNPTIATATQRAYARKEARQTILAFIAGAQLKGGTGAPARQTASPYGLLYEKRPWILAESTLSAPATVTPPLHSDPKLHVNEYGLFRDGPRKAGVAVNGISQGFGLRNPDKDGNAASKADKSLKPQMSVVLLGTNEVLHAFRAGPCGGCTAGETGGEELWAFVPFDQLGKLRERLKPQGRDPHTYVIASSLRYGDVFVPDSATNGFTKSIGGVTVKGAGVWRTILVFGRGIAGKSYTALDITAPGPFTKASLETNLPLVYWSRGNPDTNDGKTTGTKNNTSTTAAESALDFNAYARMGETWSTPALAFVDPNGTKTKVSKLGIATATCDVTKPPVANITSTSVANGRRPNGVEFVFYVGSGYPGTDPLEGTVFYGLDALTGDVVMASDVCDRSSKPTTAAGAAIENALVASPAVFNTAQLVPGFVGHSASTEATRVYIGDLHGRLWKFNTSNTGVAVLVKDLTNGLTLGEQPVANGVALLNYSSDTGTLSPHVYVEAGNDRRFAVNAAKPFKMFGFRDPGIDGNDSTPGQQLFAIDFPVDATATPVNGFRGTVQPGTAYTSREANAQGRVFFVGTKFVPAVSNCVSTFHSILFAVGAGSGLDAYDFGHSFLMQGEKAIAVRVDRGQLVVDQGLSADRLPQAPPEPGETPGGTGTGSVFVSNIRFASPVCRN